MKKLTTISLVIFSILVIAILTAGLVFYQNNKDNQVANSKNGALIEETIKQLNSSGESLVLNMGEISKHNTESDCWILIEGKVYNITGYFGSHPGGNSTMSATCGKDATNAYMTKDPNATSSGSRSAHSSGAISLLANYYIGDLNQIIGSQKITDTNNVVASNTGEDEDEYEDEYEDD